MSKRLGALDRAFAGLDAASIEQASQIEGRAIPPVLRDRNALADQAAQGRMKAASQRYVDPAKCRMWRRHNRIYALLTKYNCDDLINEIRAKRGQLTAAIVRPLADDKEGFEYEVIAGARRHFAVSYLRKEEQMLDLMYFVEVRRVSDAEAFLIGDAENRARKDITDFERAADYASALEEFYDGNAKKMAEAIGTPRTTLNNYFNLARLPKEIVAAFYNPTDIAIRYAVQLAPLLAGPKAKAVLDRAQEIERLQHSAKAIGKTAAYPGAEVFRELMAAGRKPAAPEEGRGPASIVRSEDGAVLFEFDRGRKYYTVRIPLDSAGRAAEITKELKRELTSRR
jgi:ParB family transcriptional regulator, chromosome partitioning protein